MKRKRGGGRERSFELLWSGSERAAPGPKPILSLDRTVRAAVEIVDADGLAALTLGRVAERLGVTTMAIYRYVPGKEALVDLMIDRARGAPPPSAGLGWRPDLAQWARANLALLRRHPWLLESVMSRVPIGPNWLAWLESGLRAQSGSGLTANEMLAIVVLVDGHVRSSAQISLGVTGTRGWAENFGRALQAVTGDERYSALAALVDGGGFDARDDDAGDFFEFGLERVLEGVGAFIRARAARRGRRNSPRRDQRKR